MKKILFLLFLLITCSSVFTLQAQEPWIQKANYAPGGRDDASGFAIGNTGYILSGTDTGGYFTDMWAWNSLTNIWTQVNSYPAKKRIGTRSVSFNGYGYVLGGEEPASCYAPVKTHGAVCEGTFFGDVWRYNPDSNSWLKIDTFPGLARDFGVAVVDPNDSTIYFGTGNDNDTVYLSDWWSFYIPTAKWTQLADFPGGQRADAAAFCANGNIYVGTGNDNDRTNYATSDFWQYNPATNIWTRIADLPGMPLRCASAFSIGNNGYVCLGISDTAYTTAGWKYNPAGNTWSAIAPYGGYMMADGVAFTMGTNAYVGTGSHNGLDLSQFWEYSSETTPSNTSFINLYPNPAKNTVTISYSEIKELPATINLIDALGNIVASSAINNNYGQVTMDVTSINSGAYFYQVNGPTKVLGSGKFIIAK